MVVLNKAVKILLGTGALLLLMWGGLLAYSSFALDRAQEIKPRLSPKPVKQVYVLKRKEYPEPNSPWRKLSLEGQMIPNEAKAASANMTPVPSVVSLYEAKDMINTSIITVTPNTTKSSLTFLFLHGAAFTASDWDEWGTLSLLGALGYRAIAMDLPGFGKTQKKLEDIAMYVSKVRYMSDLLKAMNLSKIVLVAPSMSGDYALPMVLTSPELFAGLVVMAPTASGIVPQSRLRALQVPTLLIYGSKDKSTLGTTSHQDLKSIPNFQAVVFQGAGHAAYLDQPDKFNSLLYNFAYHVERGVSK